MDDQTRATVVKEEEDVRPSYWLDACEDISCDDLITEFTTDLDSIAIPESLATTTSSIQDDALLDPCFFDGIFDSIMPPIDAQSDDPLLLSSDITTAHSNTDDVDKEEDIKDCNHLNFGGGMVASPVASNGLIKDGGADRGSVCSPEKNGLHRNGKRDSTSARYPDVRASDGHFDQHDGDTQERICKRSRFERQFPSSRQHLSLRERPRKRFRDWEETERRDKDSVRRRQHCG